MKSKVISFGLGVLIGIPFLVSAIRTPEAKKLHFDIVQFERQQEVVSVVETVAEQETENRVYFDVPLDTDLQDYIFEVCEEYNIAPALVVAMIEKESRFRSGVVSKDGRSTGLMQIQEKWHRDRMERLGCTDLTDPYQNVLVGIDYLAELAGESDGEVLWALMAYNGGRAYANRHSDNPTKYAVSITERAYELERSIENEQRTVFF